MREMVVGMSSATISARLNSDELKLLNGTTLDVDGAGTFAGVVTATSVTANDFTFMLKLGLYNFFNKLINILKALFAFAIMT